METLLSTQIETVQSSSWKNTLSFNYVNKKGEISGKTVEVYDYDETGFFGWDLLDQKTKRFSYEQMNHVTAGEKFPPRFEKRV